LLFLCGACSKSPATDPEEPLPEPEPVDTRSTREKYSAATTAWPEAEWYSGIIKNELAELPANPHANPNTEVLHLGKVLFFEKRMGNIGYRNTRTTSIT